MKKLVGKFCNIVKEIDNSPTLVGWIEELREENERLRQKIERIEFQNRQLEESLLIWRK